MHIDNKKLAKSSVGLIVFVCLLCGLMSQSTIFQSYQDRANASFVLTSTGQPHYNTIFGVLGNRLCYKHNCVIMRLCTVDI